MTIARKILLYFAVLTGLLLFLAAALFQLYREAIEVAGHHERRFQSYLLAEKLRHSSDDLTRMARIYVITRDPRYKQYFEEIEAVREGHKPRLGNSDDIFWDLLNADSDHHEKPGQKVHILNKMRRLRFTNEEFAYLAKAKALSDDLIALERQAFNAADGLFKDEQGNYTRRGEPSPALALDLLHSPAFFQAKAKIMEQINRFKTHIDKRTEEEVAWEEAEQRILLMSVGLFTFLLIGVSIFGYLYFKKGIIKPLQQIQGWIAQVGEKDANLKPVIKQHDELGIIAESFVQMAHEVTTQFELLEKSSITDPLTGLQNRKGLNEQLAAQEYNYNRYGTDCAVIMMDIDHFKKINDNHGHLVGDRVLTETAKLLRQKMRKSDVIGRWGGDEFLIICPNTILTGARILAESTRRTIREHEFPTVGHRTASFGVSAFEDGLSADDVVNGADQALYQAKTGGRDQVY